MKRIVVALVLLATTMVALPATGWCYGQPSVNLVVLSFVNPLKLLNGTTDATTLNGLPRGMTAEVVKYFTEHGIRVMLSIGGITYTDDWNAALAENPVQLATNAAAVAERLGVGIEIDYEENTNPNLAALQAFIDRYRELHPYDPSGANHAARLTLAARALFDDQTEAALGHLLELARSAHAFRDDIGRRAMIALFDSLSTEQALTRRFRAALAELGT